MNKISDSWCTPQDLFDVLDKGGEYMGIPFEGFNFDIDLTATKENSKCNLYCTDYLNNKYNNLAEEWPECGDIEFDNNANLDKYGDRPYYIKEITGWLNPPYSNPKTFIEKAWEDSKHCKIVALVKCDPSTQWWATFWDYGTEILDVKFDGKQHHFDGRSTKMYYGPKPGCQVLFFPKRIKFDPPQQLIDSGEVWDLNCSTKFGLKNPSYKPKWVQKCSGDYCCEGHWMELDFEGDWVESGHGCPLCKGKGYTPLSGPSFSCALIIMDRRNV